VPHDLLVVARSVKVVEIIDRASARSEASATRVRILGKNTLMLGLLDQGRIDDDISRTECD
jgi:ribosomal protein S28E/S33